MKFLSIKETLIDNLDTNVGNLPKLLRGKNKISTTRLKFSILLIAIFASFMPAAVYAEENISIVALGDSLTAGYQLPPNDSFPAQLEKTLLKQGHKVKVVNAGVSGDTTTGGLARLDWSVPEGADIVILELGANDALRGISPTETRKNLDKALQKLKTKDIIVLLAGMQAPRNLGKDYISQFDKIYPELSKKHNVLLYPFFLEGIALNPGLNLSDGMHPNTKGVAVIVKNILPFVEKLIKQAKTRKQ